MQWATCSLATEYPYMLPLSKLNAYYREVHTTTRKRINMHVS